MVLVTILLSPFKLKWGVFGCLVEGFKCGGFGTLHAQVIDGITFYKKLIQANFSSKQIVSIDDMKMGLHETMQSTISQVFCSQKLKNLTTDYQRVTDIAKTKLSANFKQFGVQATSVEIGNVKVPPEATQLLQSASNTASDE